jgi:hypothetical protein
VFHNDASPDEKGDFAFIHSDCEAYYGSAPTRWNENFNAGNEGNRPGTSLCDPFDIDGTNNDQTIAVGDVTPAQPAIDARPRRSLGHGHLADRQHHGRRHPDVHRHGRGQLHGHALRRGQPGRLWDGDRWRLDDHDVGAQQRHSLDHRQATDAAGNTSAASVRSRS